MGASPSSDGAEAKATGLRPAVLSIWPEEVVVGPGVVLRAPDPVDAEAITEAVNSSLGHLRPFMEWAAEPATIERQALRLALAREDFAAGGDAHYTIFEGDEVVGGAGLHRRQGDHVLEIGYWIRVDRQRRGLVTMSVRALIAVAFEAEGIDRVVIRCDEANIRSATIPRRLGFDLVSVEEFSPVAPGQLGRMMRWELRRPG